MSLEDSILLQSDARLADLGSLLVFRYWLHCQLQEMAGGDAAALDPLDPDEWAESAREQHTSRLFF
ncbi:hypothetical protein [Synechococcus sp. GFB01]|uniref:hypothetical protein n=1 Tax=Synechococcus sp. GFB01 TaxID=1662190 RepID=UPI00064F417A|nr:hypothetical protein [Synechococcus sp. GFB01]KMM17636.1 hypothetical protein SYNGFB01_02740 [Synechococcus sp. GFB01]